MKEKYPLVCRALNTQTFDRMPELTLPCYRLIRLPSAFGVLLLCNSNARRIEIDLENPRSLT